MIDWPDDVKLPSVSDVYAVALARASDRRKTLARDVAIVFIVEADKATSKRDLFRKLGRRLVCPTATVEQGYYRGRADPLVRYLAMSLVSPLVYEQRGWIRRQRATAHEGTA